MSATRLRTLQWNVASKTGRLIVVGVVAGCLAACQNSTQLADEPPLPTIDGAPVASNELGRLGRQDLAAGNSGLAEQHFRAAVEKNQNDVSAWIGLAAAYDGLKRFDLADRAYDQAIKLGGETFDVVNNQGYSYLLRGDRRRAQIRLQQALVMRPGNPVVENNLRLTASGDQGNRHAAP